MRTLISVFSFLIAFGLNAQTKGSLPTNFNQNSESDHFVYFWNSGETDTQEIVEAGAFAEEVFMRLSKLLGESNMPENKLIITFRGEGVDLRRQKKKTPHVDFQGRIHLYRFEGEGYLGVLPHEMVHATRMGSERMWERFFEEGLASAISYYLYPERMGFPRFGYDLDLVAGHWLESENGNIPLIQMRREHNRLNLKCQLQTYVTREHFFTYLAETHGIEKLVEFGNRENAGELSLYKEIWGKSFEILASEWEGELRRRYANIPNAKNEMEEFFESTSAKYIPVCKAGTDF